MRNRGTIIGLVIMGICGIAAVSATAHEHNVPPGPILERHELMEGIGKNAKVIGDAMKSGNFAAVGGAAEKIQAAAAKIPGLFPQGSTHANSRAKAEIWTEWPKFETESKHLEETAGALAVAAKSAGDIPAAAQAMFNSCKSCHDSFRVPEKKKKG